MLKYEKFLKICENKLIKLNHYIKVNNPKISIISPIYNREKYIVRFLKSIQYQNFKDIEIILIDDFSRDNSVKLIKKYKNIDKRIKLLKNIINKGTFKSRNLGFLYSKGQYVIFPDPDDILSKNILNLCYRYAKKYKYKVIRFNIYFVNKKRVVFNRIMNNFENRPIYQPELSTYIFYGNNNELELTDYYITNKFIKREIYLKALNIMNIAYLNSYIIFYEDQMINYIIYRISESFFFLKKIGYYYRKSMKSITKNLNKIHYLTLKFSFLFLKLVFDYSKNSKYQKDMVNLLFTILQGYFTKKLSKIKYYYKFFKNNFLKCSFITDENKYYLKKFNFK